MIDRPNWADKFDTSGNALVPAEAPPKDHQALVAEIAAYNGPAPSHQAPPVPAKSKGFSGLPDWDVKPSRDEQGRFVAKSSDAGIVAELGLTPEVAAVLSAQPDGLAAAADNLRTSMSGIWGDDAAQVAQWATELSPAVQAKCAKVLMQYPHVRKAELAKRIRATLTLNEAAEIEAWLNKD